MPAVRRVVERAARGARMAVAADAAPVDRALSRLAELTDLGATRLAAASARAMWATVFIDAWKSCDATLAMVAAREYVHFDRIVRGLEPPG